MEIIDHLFRQLKAGRAKDSPEIRTLLASITDPAIREIADRIVANWVPVPDPVPPPAPPVDRTTLVGGGIGVAGLISTPWIRQGLQWLEVNHKLTVVTDPIELLVIVAAFGAVAGAGYSIFANRGIVLPSFGEKGGTLTLTRYGIVNEVFFGAVAAITTIWLATVGLAPAGAVAAPAVPAATVPAAGGPNPPAVVVAPPVNLLSYSVIAGSLIAGWFGARMRTFRLGQDLLQAALAQSVTNDKLAPETATQILEAPTAATAATLATGMKVVGANATVPVTPIKTEAEAKLLKLLDETRLRADSARLGVLTRDGTWLTLNNLSALGGVDPVVRQVLGEFKLSEVADMPLADFVAKARAMGLDTAQLASLLTLIQSGAKEVMTILRAQSDTWKWPS